MAGRPTAGLMWLALGTLAWGVLPGRLAAETPPVPVAPGVRLGEPEPPRAEAPGPAGPVSAPGGVALDPPAPGVLIRVRVAAGAAPGEELVYRIVVENPSRAAAHHVRVRNPLPANAAYVRATPAPSEEKSELIWQFGTLEGRATKEIELVLRPTGEGDVSNRSYVSFEHGQQVVTRLNRPDVRVKRTGPTEARLGQGVTYQLEVTNAGSARADDVALSESPGRGLQFEGGSPKPDSANPLTWNLGALEPGQSKRVECRVTAVDAGASTSTAKVTARGNLQNTATGTLTVGEPKLEVVKSGPAERLVNRPATYTITVRNTGAVAARGVQVTDDLREPLREGFDFLGASSGGQLLGGQVRWQLGDLPPGGHKTVQMTVRTRQAGKLSNIAEARADGLEPLTAKSETKFVNPAGVAVEIDRGGDAPEVGREGTYTVRLVNPTNAPAAGLRVTVTGSEQLKFLRARGPTQGQMERDKPLVQFQPLPSLGAGGEAVYVLQFQALAAGEARLSVEVASTPPGPALNLGAEDKLVVAPAKP